MLFASIRRREAVDVNREAVLLTQDVQQKRDTFDALFSLEDAAQAGEGTIEYFNQVTFSPAWMLGTVIDNSLLMLLDCFDGGLGHYCRLIAETHQSDYTQRGAYRCEVIYTNIELDKQVAGEKRFDDFLPAVAPVFGLHGMGTVCGESLALQVVGGEAFLARFGLHHVPVFMAQDFPLFVPLALAQLRAAVRRAPAPASRIPPAYTSKTAR